MVGRSANPPCRSLQVRPSMSRPKPNCESLEVTQEERATMVALAEVFRDIFRQQRRSLDTKPKAQFDNIIDSNLTGTGKLLLQ